MTKHTPGPWFAEVQYGIHGEDCRVSIFPTLERGFRGEVCSVSDAQDINGISIEERNANSALIVAAPDLLEALQALVDAMSAEVCDETGLWSEYADAIAALAKARGES